MNDLPLKGIHWGKFDCLAAFLDLIGSLLSQLSKARPLIGAEAIQVEH